MHCRHPAAGPDRHNTGGDRWSMPGASIYRRRPSTAGATPVTARPALVYQSQPPVESGVRAAKSRKHDRAFTAAIDCVGSRWSWTPSQRPDRQQETLCESYTSLRCLWGSGVCTASTILRRFQPSATLYSTEPYGHRVEGSGITILSCIEWMRRGLFLPVFAVSVSQSVCLSRGSSRLHCGITDEHIKILFGVNTLGGPINIVRRPGGSCRSPTAKGGGFDAAFAKSLWSPVS